MIRVREEIVIERPIAEVWAVFEAIETWSAWLSFMPKSHLEKGAPWEKGSVISFTIRQGRLPLPLRAKIYESNPPKKVLWGARGPGLSVRHAFEFEEEGDATRVVSWEEFRGPVSGAIKLAVKEEGVRDVHRRWLAELKAEAERRARSKERAG